MVTLDLKFGDLVGLECAVIGVTADREDSRVANTEVDDVVTLPCKLEALEIARSLAFPRLRFLLDFFTLAAFQGQGQWASRG